MKTELLLDHNEVEQLTTWSRPVRDLVIEKLADDRGVRIETAISGLAAVAGCLLLRSTGVRLSNLKPGAPVFVDAINDLGAEHFRFMSAACVALGVEPFRGWREPVPPAHEPRMTPPELTALLEIPFVLLCERVAVPSTARPQLASFTAIALMREGVDILSAHVGKALALNAVVAASKTVPPRDGNGRRLWEQLGGFARRAALMFA